MSIRTPNRRSFLKSTATTTVAVAGAPLILNAQDKAGSRDAVVGTGQYTFRCEHFWGHDALPTGADYGNASHGVAVDKSGLIYITHSGRPDSVYVFDAAGKFVRSLAGFHTTKKNGASSLSN